MKRRQFLIGSAGALGAMTPAWVMGQSIPCPVPSLTTEGEGGETVTTACLSPNLALAQACAALSVGQSADFSSGAQSAFTEADLAWQTAFYHDDLHGLVHLMGKPANADTSWKHQYYTVAENKWTVVSNGMWDNPGHIYGAMTLDPATGDVFQWRGGMDSSGNDHYKRAGWWKHSTKTWGYTPVDIFSGALVSHPNGSAYHPHLYGTNDGGLILESAFRTMFWRKSNNTVQDIAHGGGAYGNKEGVGVYWADQNAAFVGGTDGGQLLRVMPNGGSTPKATPMGRPPLKLAGNSHGSSTPFGSLHVHPGNPRKLLIVETNGSRAWTSTDGASWTQIGNHPFTLMPRVVCSLRASLGALWAVGRAGSTHYSRLWKPPV